MDNSGTRYEKNIEEWLEENQFAFARTGYEKLDGSFFEDFRHAIRRSDDPSALLIRFYPDFIVIIAGQPWLMEVKSGETINKLAYESYKRLAELGFHVGVILPRDRAFNKDGPMWVEIEDLELEAYGANDMPLIDNFWANPQELPPEKLRDFKKYGSGHPFTYIDYAKTVPKAKLLKK